MPHCAASTLFAKTYLSQYLGLLGLPRRAENDHTLILVNRLGLNLPRQSGASWTAYAYKPYWFVWVAGLEMSSQCRVKVPRNWKQCLQNDLNSVDKDVKPEIKQTNLGLLWYIFKAVFSNLCGKYNLYFLGRNISFRMLSRHMTSTEDVT